MAGLSESVLSQSVPSLQGLPHPGALSAAQLNLIASSVASQRQGIAAMQAQLRVLDEQLAMLEQILGPLTEWARPGRSWRGWCCPRAAARGLRASAGPGRVDAHLLRYARLIGEG
jgi:hypothetical protein